MTGRTARLLLSLSLMLAGEPRAMADETQDSLDDSFQENLKEEILERTRQEILDGEKQEAALCRGEMAKIAAPASSFCQNDDPLNYDAMARKYLPVHQAMAALLPAGAAKTSVQATLKAFRDGFQKLKDRKAALCAKKASLGAGISKSAKLQANGCDVSSLVAVYDNASTQTMDYTVSVESALLGFEQDYADKVILQVGQKEGAALDALNRQLASVAPAMSNQSLRAQVQSGTPQLLNEVKKALQSLNVVNGDVRGVFRDVRQQFQKEEADYTEYASDLDDGSDCLDAIQRSCGSQP